MAIETSVSFKIYNAETVRKLQEEDPKILPGYGIDKEKDYAYNRKQVNAAITSGIIQGKSIDKIADDLKLRMKTISQNSAIKAARTAMTSAQNCGTLSAMRELAAMGIEVQKEWVATLDDRTRDSHRKLDGERRDLDETFSNGLKYPGDTSGKASEVRWCRCTMVSYIPDYDADDEPRITYDEWLKYKAETGSTSGKISEDESKAVKTWLQGNTKLTGTLQKGQYSYSYEYDIATGILTVEKHNGTVKKTNVYDPSDEDQKTWHEIYMKMFGIEEQLTSGSTGTSTATNKAISATSITKNNVASSEVEKGKETDNVVGSARKLKDGEEANNWFYNQDEYQTWKDGLSKTEIRAIDRYTGSAYVNLNNVLRKYNISNYSSDEIKQQYAYAATMDKALSGYDLTESLTVRRGVTKGQVETLLNAAGSTADFNDLSSFVGQKLLDEGFGSATVVTGKAASITESKSVMLNIDIPSGSDRGAYINQLSQYEDYEYEWLFTRNAEFTITDAKEENGKLQIYATMNG